jgi:trehalose/maltose transport system permease protein
MFALTFMSIETQKTVTVGVATLSGAFTYDIPWGQLAARVIARCDAAGPSIFQRQIASGLTAGAVK